jgi:CRP-like cAMP-binding protein
MVPECFDIYVFDYIGLESFYFRRPRSDAKMAMLDVTMRDLFSYVSCYKSRRALHLSTEHPRFISVRLPGSHLTSHARRFPAVHHPGAYPQAASGGLRADPVSRPGRACLHLPYSITLFSAGDFVGEEALAAVTELRLATVTTITACTALKIMREEMIRVMHGEHKFSDLFLKFC